MIVVDGGDLKELRQDAQKILRSGGGSRAFIPEQKSDPESKFAQFFRSSESHQLHNNSSSRSILLSNNDT